MEEFNYGNVFFDKKVLYFMYLTAISIFIIIILSLRTRLKSKNNYKSLSDWITRLGLISLLSIIVTCFLLFFAGIKEYNRILDPEKEIILEVSNILEVNKNDVIILKGYRNDRTLYMRIDNVIYGVDFDFKTRKIEAVFQNDKYIYEGK
jgi:hypothetical protein